jgi:hypothetical protein
MRKLKIVLLCILLAGLLLLLAGCPGNDNLCEFDTKFPCELGGSAGAPSS